MRTTESKSKSHLPTPLLDAGRFYNLLKRKTTCPELEALRNLSSDKARDAWRACYLSFGPWHPSC